jgi:hypothetical protein
MSPFSWPVVLGTIAVSSPALWAAQVSGTLSPDVALMRLLVCLGCVWAAVSVVAMIAENTVRSNDRAVATVAREAAARERAATQAAEAEAAADALAEASDGVGVG